MGRGLTSRRGPYIYKCRPPGGCSDRPRRSAATPRHGYGPGDSHKMPVPRPRRPYVPD
ncbi:hypothetical protein [Lysobacter gummosus]|uniref:hypothetical protein n=1 Tax=Lysobacter gummosus TaxID=262324 RepID=UPI00363B13B5